MQRQELSCLENFPKDWKVKNLNSLTTSIKSGLSRRLSSVDIGLPVVNSGNLQEDNLDMSNLKYWYLKDPQGANTEDYFLQDEDILLNFINSISQIGKSAIYSDIGRPVIYTTNIFRIRVKEEILSKYLFEFLKSQRFMEDLKIIIKPAVNQASFTKEDLAKIFVPLPPLHEQKKIVSILMSVNDVIKNIQKQIDKLEYLKQATMNELLTKGVGQTEFKDSEIGIVPEQWEVLPLGNYFSLTSGKSKSKNSLSPIQNHRYQIPVYGGNGINGYTETHLINKPTIAIGRVGEYCGCIHLTPDKSWITDNALYIKSSLKNFDISFMSYLLTFSNLSKLRNKGGQPLISQEPISEYVVAMPSIIEQQQIASILDNYSEQIYILLKKLLRTKFLKKSLSQFLFFGQKRGKI